MKKSRFTEEQIVFALKQGFDVEIADIGAREVVTYYHRSASARRKGKQLDGRLSIAKAWAHKYQPKKKK